MGRKRRSRSISPPRGRRGRSSSRSSDSRSSSSEERSRNKRKQRRRSRSRSRSRSADSHRRHRHRDERSHSGSRERRRSRAHRRSRSRERRRSTSRKRDSRRSRSRERRRSRSRERRRDKDYSERKSEKASGSAKQQVEKLREQRKAALTQAEKTDDALKEQFDERYYRDGDKVRWERFGGDDVEGGEVDDEKALLAEAAKGNLPTAGSATVAATSATLTAVPPPSQAMEAAQRHTAIEAIDNPKFQQKAFVSKRLGVDVTAPPKHSPAVSSDLQHESAIFGSSSSANAKFGGGSTGHGSSAPVPDPSSLWTDEDNKGMSSSSVMGELLDVSVALKKENWVKKLHQLRLDQRQQTSGISVAAA